MSPCDRKPRQSTLRRPRVATTAHLGIRELLLHVVLSENVVDDLEHTGLVQVDVAQADGAVVQDRAERNLGEVDRADRRTIVEVADQRAADFGTDHALRFLSRATDVRGQDQVRARAELGGPVVERVAKVGTVRGRLGGEDVDGGTGELARLESINQGRDVDHLAARIVDQVRAVLHLADLGAADHVLGLGQLGHVQGQKVGLREEVVEVVDLASGAERHDRDHVVVDDRHAHRLGENGQLRTDVAVSDNLYRIRSALCLGALRIDKETYAESLSPDFPAALRDLVPDAFPHLARAVAQLPRERNDLGDDEFGDGARVGERRVEDGDTGAGGGEQINLVGTDAEAADDEELRRQREMSACT